MLDPSSTFIGPKNDDSISRTCGEVEEEEDKVLSLPMLRFVEPMAIGRRTHFWAVAMEWVRSRNSRSII